MKPSPADVGAGEPVLNLDVLVQSLGSLRLQLDAQGEEIDPLVLRHPFQQVARSLVQLWALVWQVAVVAHVTTFANTTGEEAAGPNAKVWMPRISQVFDERFFLSYAAHPI